MVKNFVKNIKVKLSRNSNLLLLETLISFQMKLMFMILNDMKMTL